VYLLIHWLFFFAIFTHTMLVQTNQQGGVEMRKLQGWLIIIGWFLFSNLAMDIAKWFGGTAEVITGLSAVASFMIAAYWADLYLEEGA